MARKFFYVCAGLLMLVVSFHVGATFARAQAGIVSAGYLFFDGRGVVTAIAVVGRQMYMFGQPTGLPIPGSGEVRWVGVGNGGRPAVMLESGDCYYLPGNGSPPLPGDAWVPTGNPIGFTTVANRASWGQLKAHYAPNGGTVSKGADTR